MTAEFRMLPDLAVRNLGGGVLYANDEGFAARENLITPGRAVFDPTTFGLKGKIYDGWETRRRREAGHDTAIVRLGVPGIVRGVVIDTAWFVGNYPPEASVEGLDLDGHPSVEELVASDGWEPLLPRTALGGDRENVFGIATPAHPDPDSRVEPDSRADPDSRASGPRLAGAETPTRGGRRVTHVRLRIYPDGGVARLRVHGEAVPDPRLLDALGVVDLAAIENGGRVTGCSNLFYSSPNNLLLPGPARTMGEGWETARRRDDGNDWVEVALGAESTVAVAELDTSWFLHNAPGSATLRGRDTHGVWHDLLPRTPLQPDTRHRFLIRDAPAVSSVRLDVHPDGGMARLRMFGTPTPGGRDALGRRWAARAPR